MQCGPQSRVAGAARLRSSESSWFICGTSSIATQQLCLDLWFCASCQTLCHLNSSFSLQPLRGTPQVYPSSSHIPRCAVRCPKAKHSFNIVRPDIPSAFPNPTLRNLCTSQCSPCHVVSTAGPRLSSQYPEYSLFEYSALLCPLSLPSRFAPRLFISNPSHRIANSLQQHLSQYLNSPANTVATPCSERGTKTLQVGPRNHTDQTTSKTQRGGMSVHRHRQFCLQSLINQPNFGCSRLGRTRAEDRHRDSSSEFPRGVVETAVLPSRVRDVHTMENQQQLQPRPEQSPGT